MGTNTIPTAAPNTTIPSAHHNAMKDAVLGDVVPRNSVSSAPEDEGGNIGQSAYRWLQGFIKKIFIGSVGDNISLEGSGGNLVIKVGGNTRAVIPQATNFLPPGMIVPFGGVADVGTHWLLCDGREVSRTTYSELFTAIGTSFGQGNNTTTFNLPDLRGRFLRGVDNGQGRDPDAGTRTASGTGGNTGDAVGSYEEDAFQGHWHGMFSGGGAGGNPTLSQSSDTLFTSVVRDPVTDGANGTPRVTSETRPKNINVNYLIKT